MSALDLLIGFYVAFVIMSSCYLFLAALLLAEYRSGKTVNGRANHERVMIAKRTY
jgi:hypothetical protein